MSEEKRICPVCGDILEEYKYAYDNNQYGKKYYKCKTCGHKENTMGEN
ncbi:hypothetical protein [uncultured Clostridium sp.]|nr:hypothetical protein [uncultured Clostridium sp.]